MPGWHIYYHLKIVGNRQFVLVSKSDGERMGGVPIQYHGMNALKQRPNTVGYIYKTIELIISEALPTIYYKLMISRNV